MMVAKVCDLKPGTFVHTIGDAHVYSNHKEQVITQLNRNPKFSPKLYVNTRDSIFDYTLEDFTLANYIHDPYIKAPIAV